MNDTPSTRSTEQTDLSPAITSLTGRVALVTGAARGIGFEFARAYIAGARGDVRGTVWREMDEMLVAGRLEHLPRRLRDWLTAELRGRLVPFAGKTWFMVVEKRV